MQALLINAGQDTGGQGIRWKRAADRHLVGRLRLRAVTSTITYAKYPTDILSSGNGGAIRRLWIAADVIHLNNHYRPYERYGRSLAPKPVLMHYHGTLFRTEPEAHMQLGRSHRAVQAVSTLDLTEPDPDNLHWLPTAYDLDALAETRRRVRRKHDGIVRIATAPTFRDGKGTEYLIRSVERLKAEGLPLELDLIEGVTNAECIARKAHADIYFDQISTTGKDHRGNPITYPGGYGCNAIEAWGMGIPVIAGATPYTTARMRQEFNRVLPFANASAKTLTSVLRRLVQSADLRAEYGARGLAHVQRYHGEVPALERLFSLYKLAIRTRAGEMAA